jgi:hypothetical protein
MIISRRKTLLVLIVVSLMIGFMSFVVQDVQAGLGWTTAYDVKFTHWDEGLPHYGAWFTGSYGDHQYYTGSSGEPDGYGSWDWWGNALEVLLLQKRWLFLTSDAWTGSNHHAYMYGW